MPFLNEEGGKTVSDTLKIPSISLPKGGGAIRGIDEKFSVNAVNGTASFSIPVPVSPARGCTPSLNLSYNSGGGNSIFGLGWALNTGSVKRKTEKQLPSYHDSDTFLLSEAEDLVAEFRKNPDGSFLRDMAGDYIIHERDSPDGTAVIRNYRPRTEGLFARIERWTQKASGEIRWRVISKENITTLYGWSAAARISDPDDEHKIYEWLPEWVFDDKGNCTHYVYRQEDAAGFEPALPSHRNRWKNGSVTYTNRYPDKILYGNKTPYHGFGHAFPPESDYLFQVVFDYGTLQAGDPFDTLRDWDYRRDSFSVYRAGFEIRTTRLCKRILIFHVFEELSAPLASPDKKTLVRSLNFSYDTSAEEGFSSLSAVSLYGYIRKPDGSWSFKKMPSLELDYSKHSWNRDVRSMAPEEAVHAPEGLSGERYHFTDLFNEGLNGILTEQANGWYYKHNLGGGKFERAKAVSPKPSFSGLGAGMQLADLDADGGKQLVSFEGPVAGYFELGEDWEGLRTFMALPNIAFGDAHTRMLDLTGDGKPDVMISEEQVFTWYASEGRKGFSGARRTMKPWDEEEGAHIVFADEKQSIFLADMSGDGLTDLVRVRNGEVCYWPNLGYGRFGRKVTLDHSPVFDGQEGFNPAYIRLADIDGSGTSDLIYLGKHKFSCWKNLNGNGFSVAPFEIEAFPEIHSAADITVTDLLGNGVACIVWSSALGGGPLKYIDLMSSRKPHILVAYRNNLGKEVELEYVPSTYFYIQDKLSGNPWITRLPFPVHCIAKTTTRDKITGYRWVSEYTYHHGFYDPVEKEFRGFGRVEQTDSETFEHWVKQTAVAEEPLHQEPVLIRRWYHTGGASGAAPFENDYWYRGYEKEFGGVVHPEIPLEEAFITGPDGLPVAELSPAEWREALRACKSMPLRQETLAKDALRHGNTEEARKKAQTPFTVSTHNCVIELLQPKGKNKHAVFVVKEREAITYHYERKPEDPRIAHQLNVLLDEYGHLLESASVVYPRKTADPALPEATRREQEKVFISYTQNRFTNDVSSENNYRLRLPSETRTFELKGVSPSASYYSVDDFRNILSDTVSDTALYHEMNKTLTPGKGQKRLIEHLRSTYYRDDLLQALPLHRMESLGLPYEQYQLAYTPELLGHIFGTRAGDALMEEGKFIHSEGDGDWWVRSGTMQFREGAESMADVRNRFFCPVAYTDPFGAVTRVKKDARYHLYDEETQDMLGNTHRVEAFNYRTLSPRQMKDINGNLSEVLCDELGLVKAMAVMGKGTEADDLTGLAEMTDPAERALTAGFFTAANSAELTEKAKSLLNRATARFVYDLDTSGRPAVAAVISREQHAAQMADSPVQIAFEYSDGTGGVTMKKVQAEPGLAKKVIWKEDGTLTVHETDTRTLVPEQLRWIGNGRTVKNNKGNVVKQYEPYFSLSWHYEDTRELVEAGVTPLLHYDAPGRLIMTKMPDGTFSKVEFDSWKQQIYDGNDTVTESDWFRRRTDPAHPRFISDAAEQQAAAKAALHAGTPDTLHLDTLGRPVLSIAHNKDHTGADEFYLTRAQLDTEGNLRAVTDARGNTVVAFQYDMLGQQVYRNSCDAGQRWMITNVSGKPLRTWDEREHEFQYFYDIAQRPVYSRVSGGDGDTALDHIYDRLFYGESLLTSGRGNEATLQARNVLGQVIRHFDTGGMADSPAYDFKGQPLAVTRRLFKKYREVADWTDAHLNSDLETDAFTFTTETDALGRVTRQTAPDGSIILPRYNAAGLLAGERVQHPGAASATAYIKDIRYNAKGQREKITYGNDVHTTFSYDKETFRLRGLESKRQNGDPLQNWSYTYDPAGNITQVEDRNIPVVFFDNQKITGVSAYTYDALYRLVEATGRENEAALSFGTCDNWNDRPFLKQLNPGDPLAVRNYSQRYRYDEVGNIREMRHLAAGGNWTRAYEYEDTGNRLKSTRTGDNGSPVHHTRYRHHARHGFLEELPHLEKMGWNFKEQMVLSVRQHCTDDNIPVTTYYQYDGNGQRIRKITENQAAPGAIPSVKEERIYISGYEVYRKHSGSHAGLERTTLGLLDNGHRFVMAETRNSVDDGTEKHLVRYQLGNHQGSAALELDESGRVISYEEYHPFGTTAYQATNSAIRSAAKRYRYTGMERDEETGLEYHSARYYLPWLGRWLSCDPIGLKGGINPYVYCSNNSIKATDTSGLDPDEPTDIGPLRLSNLELSDASQFRLGGSITIRNLLSANRSVVINDFSANGMLRFNSEVGLPSLGLSGTGSLELNLEQLHLEGEDFSARIYADAGSTMGPMDLLTLDMDLSATGRMTIPQEVFLSDWSQQFDDALSTFSGEATLTTRLGLGPLVGFGRLDATARGGLQGDLDASGYARIGGYRLLEFSGAGSFSQNTYNMEGGFHGNFPLLLWGNWSMNNSEGFRASGHYFGPQLGPIGLNVGLDPLSGAGEGRTAPGDINLFEPGVSLGYTYFSYGENGSFIFSAGFSPVSTIETYNPAQPQIPVARSLPLVGDFLHQQVYGRALSAPAGPYGGVRLGVTF